MAPKNLSNMSMSSDADLSQTKVPGRRPSKLKINLKAGRDAKEAQRSPEEMSRAMEASTAARMARLAARRRREDLADGSPVELMAAQAGLPAQKRGYVDPWSSDEDKAGWQRVTAGKEQGGDERPEAEPPVGIERESRVRRRGRPNRHVSPEGRPAEASGQVHERVDMVLGLDRVPKTNSRGRATRLKIIEAARRILIEQGTDKLSIDRVLDEAKVSKGSFIHHYPSRSALIEALVDSYAQHLDEVQRELEQRARETTDVPSRLLRAYGDWYREFSEGRIDRGISPFAALAVASPENRQLMTPVRCWYREYFNRVKREPCGPTTSLIVTLAYDALFFHHLLGTDVLTAQEKRHVVEGLERLSGNLSHSNSAPDFEPGLLASYDQGLDE